MQTKKFKARARAKGKTGHLRLCQRRLDEDPSAGTLNTADTSLRDCPELDTSESRANNSCWPSSLSCASRRLHGPSEVSHWARRGERKGESETATILLSGPASQVRDMSWRSRCCLWMAVISPIQRSLVR